MSETVTTQKTQEGRLLLVDFRNVEFVWNIREQQNYGNLQELADSLSAFGQAQPAKAKYDSLKNKWILKDGHRRYLATKLNIEQGRFNVETDKFKIVPVSKDYSEADTVLEMFVSNDSKPLEILEQAEGIRLLKTQHQMTLKGISDKIGKPLNFVKNLDLLSDAPAELKKKISSKKVSASTVIELLKKESDMNSIMLLLNQAELEALESGGLGSKITKKHIQKSKGIQTSLAYFKGIMNIEPVEQYIKPEKVEAFKLLRSIIRGEKTSLEIEQEFLM